MRAKQLLTRRYYARWLGPLFQYWCYCHWLMQLTSSLLLAALLDGVLIHYSTGSIQHSSRHQPSTITAPAPTDCTIAHHQLAASQLSRQFWSTLQPLLIREQLSLATWQRHATSLQQRTAQPQWQLTFVSSYPHFIHFLQQLLTAFPPLQVKQLTIRSTAQSTTQGVRIETLFQLSTAKTDIDQRCLSADTPR